MKNFMAAAVVTVGAAVSGYAPSASAAIVDVTLTGTVYGGYDGLGLFAPTGTDLTGYLYVAHYTFDTTLGYTCNCYAGSLNYIYAYGGSTYGVPSPLLGATLTINGNTVSFPGDVFGEIYGNQSGGYGEHVDEQGDYYSFLTDEVYGPGVPATIDTPFSITIDNTNIYGDGTFFKQDPVSFNYINGYLSPATLSVTVVPEPASLALLGAALAGMGLIRRRRTA